MSDNLSTLIQLLIPGAGLAQALGADATLPPNLRALLARMAVAGRIECAPDSLAMPHEIALARLHGLPGEAGFIPWAAFETGTVGTPCAWIKPCYWQVGTDHVLLADPAALALDEAASRALLEAAAPYCLEDGIVLTYAMPGAWLAAGEMFRSLPCLSTDRAIGQHITRALFETTTRDSPVLRRLQNEMQMLFYTHPVNDARQERGLLPVNSFWISGAGILEQPVTPQGGIVVEPRLAASALMRDATAHAAAWREVDAGACARLLEQLKAGRDVRLTLCGEQRAITFAPQAPSLMGRLAKMLGGGEPHARILEQL
jgi:hypothetical protein